MVPSAIIPVNAIPVTARGKVDEEALLLNYTNVLDNNSVEPESMSAVETSLRAIWRQLFAQDNVGLDDNFFNLGGDSVMVMDLVSSVREQFGIQIDSMDAYTTRTIRSLAQLIEERQGKPIGTVS